jgi:hypothetical protein
MFEYLLSSSGDDAYYFYIRTIDFRLFSATEEGTL